MKIKNLFKEPLNEDANNKKSKIESIKKQIEDLHFQLQREIRDPGPSDAQYKKNLAKIRAKIKEKRELIKRIRSEK